MICPNCSKNLTPIKTKTAILDMCPACKGIWFDAGEFGDFVKQLSQNEKIEPAKLRLYKRREVHKLITLKEKQRSCPKCKVKMKKINYAYDSNVILDKCPDCGGLWADEGESKKNSRLFQK